LEGALAAAPAAAAPAAAEDVAVDVREAPDGFEAAAAAAAEDAAAAAEDAAAAAEDAAVGVQEAPDGSEGAPADGSLPGGAVATAFSHAGNGAKDKIGACAASALAMTCVDCGAVVIFPSTCKHRFCPACVGRSTGKIWSDREHVVTAFQYPAHVVLALPNVPQGGLKAAVDGLLKGFRRLKRSGVWVDSIPRAFVAWGLTWNVEAGTWHPHFHMIVDAAWVPRRRLLAAAQRAFRLDAPPALYVKRQRGHMRDLWFEVFKGTCDDAFWLLHASGAVFGEAVTAFHGRKRFWFLGDYPPAVKHCDDLPTERFEYLISPAYSLCPGCPNRAGSKGGWLFTSFPFWSEDGRPMVDRWEREYPGFCAITVEQAEKIAARAGSPGCAAGRGPPAAKVELLFPRLFEGGY
jgi:hypothetical protein